MRISVVTSFLSLFLIASTVLSQDENPFYDYGWLNMMHSGEDYETIINIAEQAYADDSTHNQDYNFKHYLRWRSFWQNRIYSSDEDISNGKYGMFYHHAKASNQIFNQSPCANHSSSDWESWGFDTPPSSSVGSGMGVMWCVKIDTADHSLQTLYAGSPIGGLWKTTDQGQSWFNLTDVTNLPGMAISDIDIDPYDNNHLLVGTGTYWAMSPAGVGVIESFDGGQSWSATGFENTPIDPNSPKAYVDIVAFHPKDSNRFYASSKDSL